jgi:hypothetical protein
VFISVFVLFQFLIPLTYLARQDRSDERFSWRRLADPEAPRCEASAMLERLDGGRETLSLYKLLHRDWVDYLQQGRRSVIDAFLRQQCEAPGVAQAELVHRCSDERGTRLYSLQCGTEQPRETARTAAR